MSVYEASEDADFPDSARNRITETEVDKDPLVKNYLKVADFLMHLTRRKNALEVAKDCIDKKTIKALEHQLDKWIDDILDQQPHDVRTKQDLLENNDFRKKVLEGVENVFPLLASTREEVHRKYEKTRQELANNMFLPAEKLLPQMRIVNAMDYFDDLTSYAHQLIRRLKGIHTTGVTMGGNVYNGQRPYITQPITSHFAGLHGLLQPDVVRSILDTLHSFAGSGYSAELKHLETTFNESFRLVEGFLTSRRDAVSLTLIKSSLEKQCRAVTTAIAAFAPLREKEETAFIDVELVEHNFEKLVECIGESLNPQRS